ncbi:MAG: Nif11-like leader peptide family natural product precursor [Anaerolineales bacterium]|nr:Nif11-like leader peptide family natural product precursor [Chloroflexota bacterium]MBL6982841.1 Nif11-like leader peptide family natural product precursor [Anaerolineales bacterium]
MSNKNVIAFGKKIATNPVLLAEIQNHCKDLAELVALGQREGLDFSEQELSDYLEAVTDRPVELSDEELTQVAGGIPGGGGYSFTYGCTGEPKYEINGVVYCSGG